VFSPPLIITKAQIEKMVDILRQSIILTMHDIQHELGIELV
jgi:adenosylmethionine-8-amino-7-oxononanoate aminotransferase